MELKFSNGKITIQATADAWGPFNFNFADGMPPGRTIASVVVTSYLGKIVPDDSDVLAAETLTTDELIDTASTAIDATGLIVSVYFNRPTTAAYINVKHSLLFTFTMDAAGGGGTHTAFFYAVEVI